MPVAYHIGFPSPRRETSVDIKISEWSEMDHAVSLNMDVLLPLTL